MPTTPTPADQLRAAAERARETGDPLHTALACWLEATAHRLDASTHPGWQSTVVDPGALAVARQLLGATETAPSAASPSTAAMLATPCDACDHTLNWHRNDVGCTVPRCVCGRFQDPIEPPAAPPAPADRAAVLTGPERTMLNYALNQAQLRMWAVPGKFTAEDQAALVSLRRLADGAAAGVQPPTTSEADTLAAALDGLATLIATSSRDWGTYRVDAWLYAVLLGWDCEQDTHDETCVHGSMEEMQRMHGWDDAAVAKARRYRAAVRALTTPPAVPAAPEDPQ
ncbi:hypothetical protein [Streptomyces sp. NPDC017448]|uniref:hypothetical protein n=1 Tax=Streptomyces sp. NPDC017448 TaxID=3364996 RepID=UPI0037BDABD4